MSFSSLPSNALKPFVESDFTVSPSSVQVGNELGRGNFSRVYKGTFENRNVAVKQQEIVDPDLERYLLNELAILRSVHHDGCIAFYGAYKSVVEGVKYVHILTEYLEGGDLRRLCSDKSVPLGWKYRSRIAHGVSSALLYLHSLEVIHRDIKSENVLITRDGVPKLCDFGFARKWNKSKQMTMCGTDEFMAPEIYFGMNYDEKVDVFSFGIMMAELCTRKVPGKEFLNRDAGGGFEVNVEELEQETKNCPTSLLLLTKECVQPEASNRMSASDVVAWLDDFIKELPADVEPLPLLSSEVLQDKIVRYLDHETQMLQEEQLAEEEEEDKNVKQHHQQQQQQQQQQQNQQANHTNTGGQGSKRSQGSGGVGGLFSMLCMGGGTSAIKQQQKQARERNEMGGWVTKRGGRIKTWKRRYMVINNTGILYFKSPEDHQLGAEALGAISYQEMTAVAGVVANAVPTVMTGKPHSFGVHTADRTYYIAAANAEERSKWIRAISDGHRALNEQRNKKPGTSSSKNVAAKKPLH